MKLQNTLVLLLSLLTISCHKINENTEKPVAKNDVAKADTVDTTLPDSIIAFNAQREADEKENQKALQKYDLKNYPNARFKIFYGQSYGYDSYEHRYGYIVMIVDSTVYIRFRSPENESWNAVKYEKSYRLLAKQFQRLDSILTICKLRNKKAEVEYSQATGTASYRLIILTDKLKADGRVEWGTITAPDMSQVNIDKQIREEKKESSTIAGNYELLVLELEKLFPGLNNLKQKMKK